LNERPRREPPPLAGPRPAFDAPAKQRRALTHVGGATTTTGDAELAAALAAALDVPPSVEVEELARAHVHGFHSYPARMHPVTARRLVEALSARGDAVLDPFCGSGTVLVEARLAGRRAVGVDANPLAVRLARRKTRPASEAERAALVAVARAAAEVANGRRKARVGASRRYPPADAALFDGHVLLELDGLRVGLDAATDERARADVELALSAILTKVSRKTSDTSEQDAPRRIAAGYPSRLLVKKTEELAARLAEVEPALDAAPPALVLEGDARALEGVADGSIALVVTSPPYPGVYDYLAHHEARLRWLRLRAEHFDRREIGARRTLDPLGARAGLARWKADMGDALAAMARALRPGGRAALLVADSVVAGAPVYAVDVLAELTPGAGLEVVAVASQERPHFHGPSARAFVARPRGEHAVLLAKPEARDDRPSRPRQERRQERRHDQRPDRRRDQRPEQRSPRARAMPAPPPPAPPPPPPPPPEPAPDPPPRRRRIIR
jgi:SAM-dependent methyltransferase